MAAKQAAGKLYPVEGLKDRTNTDEALHRGVCNERGWKAGRMLTEEEYQRAVEAYKKQPMGRRA